jgi:hypothetical protein
MSADNARYARKNAKGVRQELYCIYRANYAVRVLMAQASIEAALNLDWLSLSEGMVELTKMSSFALTVEPEQEAGRLLKRLLHKVARHVLPPRRLCINRRFVVGQCPCMF